MSSAKSFIFKVKRNWLDPLGIVGCQLIELGLNSERIELPGYPNGDVQGVGSDLLADAVELTGSVGRAVGSTVGYGLEPGESHGGYPVDNSAWYKWTAPITGTVYFNSKGSTDYGISGVVVAVYTGDTIGTLVEIDVVWKETGYDWKSLSFEATEGQEYKIAVCGVPAGTCRLNYAQFEAYSSNASTSYPAPNAFRRLYDRNSYYWQSENSICDLATGYTVDDHEQLVLVFAEDIEFNKVIFENYHVAGASIERGVREADIYFAYDRISQADAEDNTKPIPGEVLLLSKDDFPQHSAVAEVDEITLDVTIPEFVPPPVGSMGASFGLKFTSEGSQAGTNTLKCGLAISASITGGATNAPAELLAGIGLGMSADGELPTAARLRAGLCLTCLMSSERVPDNILKAGLALGAKMEAAQKYEGSLNAGLFLGCSMGASAGPPPCLAQEFQHMKWF